MDIMTDFNVKDKVWLLVNDSIIEVRIERVNVQAREVMCSKMGYLIDTKITYLIDVGEDKGLQWFLGSRLFLSKKELIESL